MHRNAVKTCTSTHTILTFAWLIDQWETKYVVISCCSLVFVSKSFNVGVHISFSCYVIISEDSDK